MMVECEACGNMFRTFPSEVQRGRKFCSQECYYSTRGETELDAEIKDEAELMNFLDGLILSDATYRSPEISGGRNSSFRITLAKKSEEWIYHISSVLRRFGVRSTIGSTKIKGSAVVNLITPVSRFFREQEKRWYYYFDGKRAKRVPRDLILTPTVVLNWFLGDGTSSYMRGNTVRITLCTNGYNYDGVRDLQQQLCNLNMRALINCSGKGNIIRINHSESVGRFFDYIGDSPVECYEYKWKLPDADDRSNYRPHGLLKDLEYVCSELEKLRGEDGELPSISVVRQEDASLFFAIYEYHGGYTRIKELLAR